MRHVLVAMIAIMLSLSLSLSLPVVVQDFHRN